MTSPWYINDYPEAPVGLGEDVAPPKLTDDIIKKLVSLFPVEVATVYAGADAFARAFPAGDQLKAATAIVAIVCAVLVPLAFIRLRGLSWQKGKGRNQILVGFFAYLVWVYATGGVASAFGAYNPLIAGIGVWLFLGIVVVANPKTTIAGGN